MSRGRLPGVALLSFALGASAACEDLPPQPAPGPGSLEPFNPLTLPAPQMPRPKLDTALRFSLTPYLSGERQQRLLDGLTEHFSAVMGTEVTGVTPGSYDESLFALQNEAVDFALVTPTLLVKMQDEMPGLYTPVATAVAGGSLVYGSYIVVKRDSPIHELSALRGKKVAYPTRLSTSGYVYPRVFLSERGIDVERDLVLVDKGRHDFALQALLDDEVDAAFVASDALLMLRALTINGPVRVLAKTGRIPFEAMVVKSSLPADVIAYIRHATLTLSVHTSKGRAVLQDSTTMNGFIPVPARHYDEVRQAWRKVR